MDTIESLQKIIQAARNSSDRVLEGQTNAKAGKLLLVRNLYQDASLFYQQAASLFEDQGLKNHQARSLNHLGICLVMLKQPSEAISPLTFAKEIAEQEKDLSLLAAIAGNLGLAYSALGDYTKAAAAHKSVLESAEILQDQSMQLNSLINLADSNLQNNNYQPALGFALVALDLAKSLESLPSLIIIYDLLGMISSRQQDLQSAVEYHQQSYLTAKSLGDLLRQGIALANQGLALEALTDLNGAFQVLEQAQEIFQLLNSDYQKKTSQHMERIRAAMT